LRSAKTKARVLHEAMADRVAIFDRELKKVRAVLEKWWKTRDTR
jgi:hypothetical protein